MRAGKLLALLALLLAFAVAGSAQLSAAEGEKAVERHYVTAPPAPQEETLAQMAAKSSGCVSCHTASDAPTMHTTPAVHLGCADCHGGDATVVGDANLAHDNPAYVAARDRAHVLPRYPGSWHYPDSANPKAKLHPAQSRGARVRPLRQPERLPRRPRGLRGVPCASRSRRPSAR